MKNSARFSKKILLFIVFFLSLSSQKTYAALSSCDASVDINSVNIGSTTDFTFTVNNTDADGGIMRWIQISAPSGSFQIDGSSNSKTYSGFAASPSTPIQETFSVTVGNSAESSSNWNVQISDDENGTNPTTCTGGLGTSIVDPATLVAPVISNAYISSVSDSSITISWTTDKAANSSVDYGADSSYGFNKSDPNMSTSHSITIDSLAGNTMYHYNIKSTDSNNNTVSSGDNTFVTSSSPQTNTVTVTNTTTTTKTVVTTPAPDTTAPTIYVNNDFSKFFAQSPLVLGTARDNKAVVKVEYSVDNGENWLPVDSQGNIGYPSTSFSFTPLLFDDGNYQARVRATDSSGNVGYSKSFTMVIDRIPPQASGLLFSLGPQILNPELDGSILVPKGKNFRLTLSEVGGATSIDVFAEFMDSSQASSSSNLQKFTLTKNPDNNLWSANLSLNKEGEYKLRFSAADGAGNKTERLLNNIKVVKSGKVNAGSSVITVRFFDTNTGEWRIWDGSSYGQENPVKTNKSGDYNLFLPAGKYYLTIESYGFQTQTTNFFTLSNSTPINQDFFLVSSRLLVDLGFFKLYWPDFSTLSVNFNNNLPKASASTNSLIGQKLPFFSLAEGFRSDSLMGKESVLTFLNTWAPSSTEQISILNDFSMNKHFNSATIIEGEKSSKISVFKKRGGYSLPMYTDPDATQVTSYSLSVLPTSYFIDRKGIIRDVVVGVLSKDEIENKLLNISE